MTVLFGATPQAPYAQYRLGEAYLKQGDTTAANGAFRKVIEGWSDSSWADQARQRLGGRAPATPTRRAVPAGGKTVVPPAPTTPAKRGGAVTGSRKAPGKTTGADDRVSALPRPQE